uniref:Uncharacterized protein n=1 Tax=Arundo donax TaxID=35708 RepID=A0A0A9HE96_ARUDO
MHTAVFFVKQLVKLDSVTLGHVLMAR